MRDWTPPEDPYPKLAERFTGRTLPGGPWIAEEKVHGANLAVRSDGRVSRAASRRRALDDDALDGFFGLTRIWPGLAAAAAAVAGDLADEVAGFRALVLYGELAGGSYPHAEVPAVPGLAPVQTGVWYGPDLSWLVFDALLLGDTASVWLSSDDLRRRTQRHGLACVPLLGRGTRAELAGLPVEFATRVPAGLPALPDNLAEGLVLKPAVAWDTAGRGPRPVQKLKTKRFAEDERYEGARPSAPPPGGVTGVPAWLVTAALDRLVPPRAAAARGKLGPDAAPAHLAAEILADALTDLADDLGGLTDDERTRLTRALRPGAAVLVAATGPR